MLSSVVSLFHTKKDIQYWIIEDKTFYAINIGPNMVISSQKFFKAARYKYVIPNFRNWEECHHEYHVCSFICLSQTSALGSELSLAQQIRLNSSKLIYKKAVRLMAQLIKFYKFYYLLYLNKRWLNSQ